MIIKYASMILLVLFLVIISISGTVFAADLTVCPDIQVGVDDGSAVDLIGMNDTAIVTTSMDTQNVQTMASDDTTPPTVTSIDPSNGATNIPPNKVINVTFSENVKNGTGWIELYDTNGTIVPVTTTINGNILTINHVTQLTNGFYTLALHTGCVSDIAGNWLAGCGFGFTVDSTSPAVTIIDPTNGATNIPLNKVIKVIFSENVKNGTGWVELKDCAGTTIPIAMVISGNVLTINHAALLENGTQYTLALHTGSVTDLAGNSLAGIAYFFTQALIPLHLQYHARILLIML